jgi:hypothetical protein
LGGYFFWAGQTHSLQGFGFAGEALRDLGMCVDALGWFFLFDVL